MAVDAFENKPSFLGYAFSFLAILIFLVYSNTFKAEWQFDDEQNILENEAVHLENITFQNIKKSFFSNKTGTEKIYRPVSGLTFALNWYSGRDNPIGYHVFNMIVHIATACALYLLCYKLLAFVYASETERSVCSSIALMAAVLWAVNPVQTQAVTYIVQRMALLAAFFSALGMLFYVSARRTKNLGGRLLRYSLCFLCFMLGLGSKENAVLFPLNLALVEWIFFRNARAGFFRNSKLRGVCVAFISIALLLVLFLIENGPLDYVREMYAKAGRPFTLEQRLMTQPSIVLGYLSQLFYPVPSKLSVLHDVAVSTSLFRPWTTVASIVVVFSLIAFSFYFAGSWPLFAFPVLFYFLNHSVESTFLPLELVFEHRNYLPSFFLFLPVSAGFFWLSRKLGERRHLFSTLIVASILLIISLCLGTYTRNEVWKNERSLWLDAMSKAPDHFRPLVYLALDSVEKDSPSPEDYRGALVLLKRAYGLAKADYEKNLVLGNMATIFLHTGNYEKAVEVFEKSLAYSPENDFDRYKMAKALVKLGRIKEAEKHARQLAERSANNVACLNLSGLVSYLDENYEQALRFFQDALAIEPAEPVLLYNLGMTLTRLNSPANGRRLLRQAIRERPDDPSFLLGLIENRARAGDSMEAANLSRRVLSEFPIARIKDRLRPNSANSSIIPPSNELIEPCLEKAAESLWNKRGSEPREEIGSRMQDFKLTNR